MQYITGTMTIEVDDPTVGRTEIVTTTVPMRWTASLDTFTGITPAPLGVDAPFTVSLAGQTVDGEHEFYDDVAITEDELVRMFGATILRMAKARVA